MSKLYPPQIQGTLPAFYDNAKVEIPYIMNKTVGLTEFDGFSLLIKDIISNETISSIKTKVYTSNVATFDFSNIKQLLTTGSYYKVQLAYCTGDNIHHYSTIGVIKYTEKPVVSIGDLSSELNTANRNTIIFNGQYTSEDSSEKVYEYRINLYDDLKQKIVYQSDWILHNCEADIIENKKVISVDEFELNYSLKDDEVYFLEYEVKTINGLQEKSPQYKIKNAKTINPYLNINLNASYNRENAYIDLYLTSSDGQEKDIAGSILISRASSEDNFSIWEEIARATYYNEPPSTYSWRDFAVSSGQTYRYSIQQYNSHDIVSNRKYSQDVEVFFEDCYLYDGERQLKIKYNPKISSFKQNVLEQKTDTIGGKYPIISRNGFVSYKEFPISGMISYLSDEDELFMTNEELGLVELTDERSETSVDASWEQNFIISGKDSEGHEIESLDLTIQDSEKYKTANARVRTTNLVDYNTEAEKRFKLKVLDFLNNGKPKLFKSSTEGNYIVRLMNSSLSPNDTLGRMLHTFSTTAIEVKDYNYKELRASGLVFSKVDGTTPQLQKKTYNLSEIIGNSTDKPIIIGANLEKIQKIEITNIIPNTIGVIYNNTVENKILGTEYYHTLNKNETTIKLTSSKGFPQGKITIYYIDNGVNDFNKIKKIKYKDIILEQFNWDGKEKMTIVGQNGKIKNTIYVYALTFIKKASGNDYTIQLNNRGLTPILDISTIENIGEVNKLTIPKDIVLEMSYQIIDLIKEEGGKQ